MTPKEASYLSGVESGQITLNGQPLPDSLASFVDSFEARERAGEVVRVTSLMLPEVGFVEDELQPGADPYTGSYPSDALQPTLY